MGSACAKGLLEVSVLGVRNYIACEPRWRRVARGISPRASQRGHGGSAMITSYRPLTDGFFPWRATRMPSGQQAAHRAGSMLWQLCLQGGGPALSTASQVNLQSTSRDQRDGHAGDRPCLDTYVNIDKGGGASHRSLPRMPKSSLFDKIAQDGFLVSGT
jgi:hypothetical protein